MKKVLSAIVLGILSVFVIGVGTGGYEVTASHEATLNARATPEIRTVTLKHGESYVFTKELYKPAGYCIGYLFKIKTLNGSQEAFTLEDVYLDANGNLTSMFDRFVYASQTYMNNASNSGGTMGYRITNHSAGAVTYRMGINIGYREMSGIGVGTVPGLDFEL